MPNLNDFFEKPEQKHNENLETLTGIRPCAKCEEDVEGGFWDSYEMIMSWKCSKGHENYYRVG